jgi:hypothetical protein
LPFPVRRGGFETDAALSAIKGAARNAQGLLLRRKGDHARCTLSKRYLRARHMA